VTAGDLWDEFNAARAAMTADDRTALAALGIDAGDVLFLIGTARARCIGDDLYEPVEAGPRAFITPILVHEPLSPETNCPAQACRFGELVDLVAWDLKHPHAFALRVGSAEWIGSYEPQFMGPDAVPVHRGVLEWLQSSCRGIVLLSRDPRSQYRTLANIQRVEVRDEAHAAELRCVLEQPWPIPPITIANRRERRRVA
jgi:hypothetical protein